MKATELFLVFTGGGIGSTLRYLVGGTVQRLANGWIFPVGTLTVNLSGCLIIGLLGGLVESRGIIQSDLRLMIFVGLLGGFTTFSSFGYETIQLFRDGQLMYAIANASLQLLLGLVCVWLGFVLSRLL